MQTLRQTATTSAYSQPDKQPVMVYNKLLYNPQMKSAYNFVPGVMGLILMLICAMMTSISIVREKETGTIIIDTFKKRNIDPDSVPAVNVHSHGPFAWGKDAHDAVHNAVVMEEVARMAWIARGINPLLKPIDSWLMDKHFMRKHGPNAYYGQK